MPLLIVLLSIWAITVAVWFFNRFLTKKICSICAGVAGTWLWMLGAILVSFLPRDDYQLLLAILMSGSVVGSAYQIEKNLPEGRRLLFKTLFIPIGFAAIDQFLKPALSFALLLIFVLCAWVLLFLKPIQHSKNHAEKVRQIEEKLEECC